MDVVTHSLSREKAKGDEKNNWSKPCNNSHADIKWRNFTFFSSPLAFLSIGSESQF